MNSKVFVFEPASMFHADRRCNRTSLRVFQRFNEMAGFRSLTRGKCRQNAVIASANRGAQHFDQKDELMFSADAPNALSVIQEQMTGDSNCCSTGEGKKLAERNEVCRHRACTQATQEVPRLRVAAGNLIRHY